MTKYIKELVLLLLRRHALNMTKYIIKDQISFQELSNKIVENIPIDKSMIFQDRGLCFVYKESMYGIRDCEIEVYRDLIIIRGKNED